jgi:homoserine dehydrogenase
MSLKNTNTLLSSAVSTSAASPLNIALVGFGTVGQGFYQLILNSGFKGINIQHIVVRNKGKSRALAEGRFEYSTVKAITDPTVEVVVEAISDADAAFEVVKTALLSGKHVITANKKMVATHLGFLDKLQKETGKMVLYEAAICGAIPVLDVLDSYLGHDQIQTVEGVFNGTANYILTEMEKGKDYEEALSRAQALGFAEADPSSDVDGWDTKYKLILAASHGFGRALSLMDVPNAGIRNIEKADLAFASAFGLRVRLKAIGTPIGCKVLPVFVDEKDPAYGLVGQDNCVKIQTRWAGVQRLYGPGAGGLATATALLGDVKRILNGESYRNRSLAPNQQDNQELPGWYYVRISRAHEQVLRYKHVFLPYPDTYLVFALFTDLAGWRHVFVAELPEGVLLELLKKKDQDVLISV